MPLMIPTQRTQEWIDAHRGRITGSTAAAVLGVDPHMGPLAAYNAIMGITVKKTTGPMQWGLDNERHAILAYENITGDLVETTGFWIDDLNGDWLGASPDGLIGNDGGLEAKCPTSRGIPTEIPLEHEIQMRVNMLVTKRSWWAYIVWMPEVVPFIARIERDGQEEIILLAKLHAWYEQHILAKTPPPRSRKGKKMVQHETNS